MSRVRGEKIKELEKRNTSTQTDNNFLTWALVFIKMEYIYSKCLIRKKSVFVLYYVIILLY